MVSVPFSSWEVEEFSATLARNRTGVDMAHGLPLPRGRVEGNHDLCPSPPHYYYYLLFLDECRETDRERGKGRERERERERIKLIVVSKSGGLSLVAQSFASFPAEVYGHIPPFMPLPF